MQTDIPEGYMKNNQGCLIPIERVKTEDKLRDELVLELMQEAQEVQALMRSFKIKAYDRLIAFADLMRDEYGKKKGGEKGNMQFPSYDSTMQVKITIGDNLGADERLGVALELLSQFMQEHSKTLDSTTQVLLSKAYKQDKHGKIPLYQLMQMRDIDIDHPIWEKAMQAASDCIHIVDTCSYLSFKKRENPGDKWENIHLNFAKL